MYVNSAGACYRCSDLGADLEHGVEIILMEEVPGVVAVRLASQKEEVKKALAEAKSQTTNKNM